MTPEQLIADHIAGQPAAKAADLAALDRLASAHFAGGQRWFLDGRNAEGKVVTNPNIGYGACLLPHADGSARPFYRLGLSANSTGISLYAMGLPDRTHLASHYGERLGKATVTGYCIRFRSLKDLDQAVLEELFRDLAAMT